VADPGLVVVTPGERGDHVAAGLGLPPRVDDRAALATDVGVVPHPRLGVDGLADGAEHPQRRQVVALGLLGAPLHEGADRGGRGVELGDAVALDDVPESGPWATTPRSSPVRISGRGVSGVPSYMTDVAPLASGP
jgi:hypothetical protein